MKYSLVIGRFQCLPPHEGHLELINTLLKEGKNVCVALRKEDGTEKNPYSVEERSYHFSKIYGQEIQKGIVKIIEIPDIYDVVHGRDVGWSVRKIVLPKEIEEISATKIRAQSK